MKIFPDRLHRPRSCWRLFQKYICTRFLSCWKILHRQMVRSSRSFRKDRERNRYPPAGSSTFDVTAITVHYISYFFPALITSKRTFIISA